MAISRQKMRVSAQTATTITLVPADDATPGAGDMARAVTNIVLTWGTARDEYLFFPGATAVNQKVEIRIEDL